MGDDGAAPSVMPMVAEPRLVATYHPRVGTGTVYEWSAVLGGAVTSDLSNDGKAAVARSATEILATWTKERPASSSDQGAAVVVASNTGSGWGAPVEIHPATHFNQQTAVTFDGIEPIVAWASAPATVSTSASADEVMAAVRETDILYSRRVNGQWSAPAPIATVAGSDTGVQLATGMNGIVFASWIHTENNVSTIYTSYLGSSWSTPAKIETGKLVDSVAMSLAGRTMLLVWTQDDGGTDASERRFTLYYSEFDGYRWNAPKRMSVPVYRPDGGASAASAMTAMSQPDDGGMTPQGDAAQPQVFQYPPFDPPESCCDEDKPGDPDNKPNPPAPPGPTGSVPGPGQPIPDPPDGGLNHPAARHSSQAVLSSDPNEKVGPVGKGTQRTVEIEDTLTYTIYFENKKEATAPAQEVFIVDRLDPSLDWSTFRFLDAAFDDSIVPAGDDKLQYHTRTTIPDWRTGVSKEWWLDITGEIDPVTGVVRWTFRTLDPETGELPEDALAGFLPPEDGTGRGQGHVTFAVRPRADTPKGTRTGSSASIIFDANAAIETNEAWNTIGAVAVPVYLPVISR
jgi:uncharacterized repeat protein (TIGR01451 family)